MWSSLTRCKLAGEVAKYLVSKVESGERRVDVIELAEFARLYRKSLTFFVG